MNIVDQSLRFLSSIRKKRIGCFTIQKISTWVIALAGLLVLALPAWQANARQQPQAPTTCGLWEVTITDDQCRLCDNYNGYTGATAVMTGCEKPISFTCTADLATDSSGNITGTCTTDWSCSDCMAGTQQAPVTGSLSGGILTLEIAFKPELLYTYKFTGQISGDSMQGQGSALGGTWVKDFYSNGSTLTCPDITASFTARRIGEGSQCGVDCAAQINLPTGIKPGEDFSPSATYTGPNGQPVIPIQARWYINGVEANSVVWDGNPIRVELQYTCPNHIGYTEYMDMAAYIPPQSNPPNSSSSNPPNNPPSKPNPNPNPNPNPAASTTGTSKPSSVVPTLAVIAGGLLTAAGGVVGGGIAVKTILDTVNKGRAPSTPKKKPTSPSPKPTPPPPTPAGPTPAQLEFMKKWLKAQVDSAWNVNGRYVPNHSNLESIFHIFKQGVIPDDLRGMQSGTCEDWANWGEKWMPDLLGSEFPGAITDKITIVEASSNRVDTHQGGLLDWFDSWNRSNHIANRIIFPNGERYVVDYWESAATGKPELIPEREWIDKWKKKIGPLDYEINNPENMNSLKTFMESYKTAHGNTLETEHQALLQYQRDHPGNPAVQTLIRSWRDRPW